MGILIDTANRVAERIKDLRPGDSVTLSVERYTLVQSLVSAFLQDALTAQGSDRTIEDFIFEADDDKQKPLDNIIPLTITRKRN